MKDMISMIWFKNNTVEGWAIDRSRTVWMGQNWPCVEAYWSSVIITSTWRIIICATFVYRILYNKNFSKKKRHKRLFLECSALWFFLITSQMVKSALNAEFLKTERRWECQMPKANRTQVSQRKTMLTLSKSSSS